MKSRWSLSSISTKAMASIAAMALMSMAVGGMAVSRVVKHAVTSNYEAAKGITISNISLMTAHLIESGQHALVQSALAGNLAHRYIASLAVYDRNGAPVSAVEEPGAAGKALSFERRNIVLNGEVLGSLEIGLYTGYIAEQTRDTVLALHLALASVFALGALGVALLVHRIVTAPLESLAGAVDRIDAEDLTARASTTTGDEIGRLAGSFNRMAESLQRRRQELEREIAERRQAEERVIHLNSVLRAIRNVNQLITHETDPRGLIEKSCEHLAQRRGYSKAWIVLFDREGNVSAAASAGLGQDNSAFQEEMKTARCRAFLDDLLAQGEPVVATCDDRPAERRGRCALALETDDDGALRGRLEHGGRLYGAMSVSLPREAAFAKEDLDLFLELSADIAYALHTIEKQREVHAAEQRYRTLVQTSIDGFLAADARGRIVDANDAYCRLSGYSREDLLAMSVRDLEVAESPEEIRQRIRRIVESGGDRFEAKHRRRDGGTVDLDISVTYLAGDGLLYAFLRDTTEQRRRGRELQRTSDAQAALNRVLSLALLDAPLPELLQLVLEHLLALHWLSTEGRGSISLVEDEPRVLVMKAHRGLGRSAVEGCARVPFGRCICGLAALNGNVEFCDRVDEHHEARYDGTVPHGHYAVPIPSADGVLGVLNIYLNEGHRRDEKEEAFLTAAASTLSGIIQRRRARDLLAASEERLRMLYEFAPDAYFLSDPQGNLIDANRMAEVLTGYSRAELAGRHFAGLGLLSQSERPKAARILKDLAGGQRGRTEEMTLTPKGGGRVAVEVSSFPVRIAGQDLVLGIARDITERRNMQQQLMAHDRLAAIGQLTSGVAHELNNPLTSVLGFSELLLERDLPVEVKNELRMVHEGAARTAKIVRNLLTFARRQPEEKAAVDVQANIEKVLELRAYEQKVNNIRVVTRFAAGLPPVWGNGFQLQQVFLNIIINAEYFMLEAHRQGTLTVTAERAGECVRIAIADDGPGIPAENLGRLFTPFFTTKPVGKGTGLGLSICYGIVTEHGGRIRAESEPGKGTTFIVELPVHAVGSGEEARC